MSRFFQVYSEGVEAVEAKFEAVEADLDFVQKLATQEIFFSMVFKHFVSLVKAAFTRQLMFPLRVDPDSGSAFAMNFEAVILPYASS